MDNDPRAAPQPGVRPPDPPADPPGEPRVDLPRLGDEPSGDRHDDCDDGDGPPEKHYEPL